MSYKTLLSVADAFQRKYSNITNPVGCISRDDYFMFGGTPVVQVRNYIHNGGKMGEIQCSNGSTISVLEAAEPARSKVKAAWVRVEDIGFLAKVSNADRIRGMSDDEMAKEMLFSEVNRIKIIQKFKWKFAKYIMHTQKCPICNYSMDMCQCLYGGSAHPDRDKERQVVVNHLYLLTKMQLRHIISLQKYQNMSYGDEERTKILNRLEAQHNAKH